MIRRVKDWLFRVRRIPYIYDRLELLSDELRALERRTEFVQEALGRIESRQLADHLDDPAKQEFRVFSQWGEDGILQWLLRRVPVDRKVFVEFGADNYNVESNTRFLLTNNNWRGLVIDGSDEAIARLKKTYLYRLYNLQAVPSFITKDNINNILSRNGITGEIGLLSIDIDGNDYWIWQAIDVVEPVIVVVEYNYRFGRDRAVTIPYEESFERAKAHESKLYFGASLKALCHLADRKGYAFVGCNLNGVNAFFVRRDKKPASIRELTAEEGYVSGTFGELISDGDGPVKMSPAEEEQYLRRLNLPLVDVEREETKRI